MFVLDSTLAMAASPDQTIEIQSATVRFASQTRIPAERSGRIESVTAIEHRPISRGQDIVRLDDSSLRLAREAAELKLQSATRRATNTVHGRFAELALAEAEQQLESSRNVQREAQGAISSNQMRRLKLAVERAKLDLADTRQRQVESQTEADVIAAELAGIDAAIAQTLVQSPVAGVVIDLPHRAGEWVAAGDTVAVVAQVDRLSVDALLSTSDLDQNVCVGCGVIAIWIDPVSGQQRQLNGKIDSTDLQHLPGARYRVHATLDNVPDASGRSWLLKPGMQVTLRVVMNPPSASRLGSLRHRDQR